jgi:serine protease AprX
VVFPFRFPDFSDASEQERNMTVTAVTPDPSPGSGHGAASILRLRLYTALFVPALTGLIASSAAHAGQLSPDLAAGLQTDPNSDRPTRVIVRFDRSDVDVDTLAGSLRGRKVARLGLVNGATLEIPKKLLRLLSKRHDVVHVSPDREVQACWDQDTASIGAEQVWFSTGNWGSGPRVAVLDTGVHKPNADLDNWGKAGSRVVAWKDIVNGRNTPYDDNGHGTHVAGIAAGSGWQSAPSVRSGFGLFNGVAPDAELVAVKVLDANGRGTVSDVIAGLEWCVRKKDTHNIRVINLSLGQQPGESYRTDPLCAAVRRAVQAGIVVVCSAGNKGKNHRGATVYGGISCPGNEPSAITVGRPEHERDRHARRRHRLQLQQPWSDLHRPPGEAGPRGAGEQDRVAAVERFDAG